MSTRLCPIELAYRIKPNYLDSMLDTEWIPTVEIPELLDTTSPNTESKRI
jgi:hypothetical protein